MATIKKTPVSMICIVLALTGTISGVMASLENDEKECADQLTNLAACIPFVSGSAKQPTKECCDDTLKLKNAKPKCLCVLIKESNDPSMGLPINTTLALQMPAACNIDAKVSDCPTLLNIPADSADAKIFKVANADSSSSTTTTPSSSTTNSPSSSSSSSSSTDTTKTTSSLSSTNSGAPKITTTILPMMGLALITLIFI